MLINHLKSKLRENLVHQPTSGQELLIDLLANIMEGTDTSDMVLIKGYAGTGKTSMISSFVKTLQEFKHKSVLLAPTGRAAKVLTSYSGQKAYTIHKKIYKQKRAKDGFGEFVLSVNLHSNTFFIVDEASMISNHNFEMAKFGSGYLLNDLISYVYNGKNCKLILIGDTAQLPPVGLEISPALNKINLESFAYKVVEIILTDVVRQGKDSAILSNATQIRDMVANQILSFPKITFQNQKEVIRLNGEEFLEKLTDSYSKYGLNDTIVINRSNKRANKYNQGIRSRILFKEEEICVGDVLMVVKNNYFWLMENNDVEFIANGDICELVAIHKYDTLYGFRFADVTLKFPDFENLEIRTKILLDTLNIESASLSQEDNKKLFYAVLEDYSLLKSKRARINKVKENPFFNALQVKFAYAVTCHKAQGGQWKSVFVDQGYVADDTINIEYLRWLYTAFTRATHELYLVNFDKRFFE